MKFTKKTWIKIVILLGVCLASWWMWLSMKISLAATERYTGFALLLIVLALAMFNGRKKIPFLPLFKASTWLQWHIYMGLFSMLLFALHTGFRIPSGVLEVVLAIVFVTVAVSGIAGLLLSRYLPSKMNRSGELFVYEQIPRVRREIREGVEVLVFEAEESCQSSTLPEFYTEHLHVYLDARASLFDVFGSQKKSLSYRLVNELQARMRYLSDDEKKIAREIEQWIEAKENLDFQEASHLLLKGWLFLHIPLSAALIILGVVHGIFTLLYGGNT